MEKKPGDIIILHKCTKTPDHRLYCSWDMVCDGCNCYFYFGLHFSLLPPPSPLTTQKMKISKQRKKHLDTSFYSSVPKILIVGYTLPETWCVTDAIFIFILGYTFPFCHPQLTPSPPLPHHTNSPKNENFKIMKKIPGYHLFTQTYQKSWSYAILLLRYGMRRIQLLFFILGKKNEKKTPWDTII